MTGGRSPGWKADIEEYSRNEIVEMPRERTCFRGIFITHVGG